MNLAPFLSVFQKIQLSLERRIYPGLPSGTYSSSITYQKGDLVYYSGEAYIALKQTTNNLPVNTTYFMKFSDKGATGATGINSLAFSHGSGVPSGGVDNDYYLNTTNGDIYKKTSGSWSVVTNLQGENGEGVPSGGTTGQILSKNSATDFDTEWIDPSIALSLGKISLASAYASFATNNWITVPLNSSEISKGSDVSINTTTNRLTINTTGIYLVIGYIAFQDSTVGGARGIAIHKNGSAINGEEFWVGADSSGRWRYFAPRYCSLSAGDYLNLKGYQNSGGNLTVNFASLTAQFLGV